MLYEQRYNNLMSLDKAIMYGKERRRPYRGAKAIDPACRNHGDDDWAIESRLHKHKKRQLSAKEQLEELESEEELQEEYEELVRKATIEEWEDRNHSEYWEWYKQQKEKKENE